MVNCDDLIYDLIFSEKRDYVIDMSEYVDLYGYEDFVEEIKLILKKSDIKIIKSVILVDSKTAQWELKIKK